MSFFHGFFEDLSLQCKTIDFTTLETVALEIEACRQRKGKVIIGGNGGSAAMASHVAVDLTKNAYVKAITFNEVDLITCFANDFGYENWLARAIECYAEKEDLVILISSSGQSQNMVNAAYQSQKQGLRIVTLSGFKTDNPLKQLGHINLWLGSQSYNIVEMTHQGWLLAVVDYIIARLDQKTYKCVYPVIHDFKSFEGDKGSVSPTV